MSALDRVRRDGYGGAPGIEPTTSEQDARAVIMAAKDALREHTVSLHVAGCHEAAHPVSQAFVALRDRYPQLPESAPCGPGVVIVAPDFRAQLADEIDAQAAEYEAAAQGDDLDGSDLLRMAAQLRTWADEIRATGCLPVPPDHEEIGQSQLASLLAFIDHTGLDREDLDDHRTAADWRRYADYAALRADLPVRLRVPDDREHEKLPVPPRRFMTTADPGYATLAQAAAVLEAWANDGEEFEEGRWQAFYGAHCIDRVIGRKPARNAA
jgi:hypothetical protein